MKYRHQYYKSRHGTSSPAERNKHPYRWNKAIVLIIIRLYASPCGFPLFYSSDMETGSWALYLLYSGEMEAITNKGGERKSGADSDMY